MIIQFLSGCICVAFLIASLFFLKFWRKAKDPLFFLFALAFALLGIERIVLLLLLSHNETQPYAYIIRLLAFSLIIAGIVAKNRR